MRWLAPPTRREITLILFCAIIFTLAYNLENSFRFIGFDASATQGVILSRLGYAPAAILQDGRRPSGWRDKLDNAIFGNHDWNDGEVLDANLDQGQPLGPPHSAMWIGKNQLNQLWPPTNEPGVSAGFWRWNDDVPTTTLLKHVPGYTILDQVLVLGDTLYIVTDEPHSFPSVDSITTGNWKVISSQTARSVIGRYGGRIHGVSWMCPEPVPQNTTLLSLWSLYSTLESSLPISGVTSLPSPARLILSQTPVFLDEYLDDTTLPRLRSSTGFHPFLPKIAFPHMGIMYQEDWADYTGMEVPYVIQRLVVADYGVAGADGLLAVLKQGATASREWWEPIRQNIAEFFEEPEQEKMSVTYIFRAGALREEDGAALMQALHKLGGDRKVVVRLVDAVDYGDEEWGERMAALLKSNVILAVHGADILDGVFLKPSASNAMIELFSPNIASREHEAIAKSLGINYVAWSSTRKLSSDEITRLSNSRSDEQGYNVPVDSDALVEAIWDMLKRS